MSIMPIRCEHDSRETPRSAAMPLDAEVGVAHVAHLAALMPEPAEADPRLAVRVGTERGVHAYVATLDRLGR
jgi:hypothetical protein